MQILTRNRTAELEYLKSQNEIEISKEKQMADIETEKFHKMVSAIGADTIKSIATAGPEMQVKLLQGLGLKSTLITDGTNPINLFNTAQGLVGGLVPARRSAGTASDDED